MNTTSSTTRNGIPEGALCADHPTQSAEIACKRCGNFACSQCVFSRVPGAEACTSCASRGLDDLIPWERRKQLGMWKALRQTTRLVLKDSVRFFRTPQTESGFGPFLYGVGVYTVGQSVIGVFLGLVYCIMGMFFGFADMNMPGDEQAVMAGVMSGFGVFMIPLVALTAPVNALMGIFIGGSLVHGTLVLFKLNKASYEQTLRNMAYANAPYLWVWVPCVGSFVWLWTAIIEVRAIRELHQIPNDKAVLAVWGYRVLIMLLLGGFYALMFLVMAASMPNGAYNY